MNAITTITWIVLLAVMLPIEHVLAQAPVFSQYYATGLYLNPALAGIEKDVLISLNYRSQWANVNLPYRTCQLSLIHPVVRQAVTDKHLGGWGIAVLNDEAGPNKEFVTQSISVSGAYNFHLTKRGNSVIVFGAQLSALQQVVNSGSLTWSSQYSADYGFDSSMPAEAGFNERVMSPVVHMGGMWYYSSRKRGVRQFSTFQGVAVSNLNRPGSFYMDKGVRQILMKFHGGSSFQLRRKMELSPNYLIQYHNALQLNVGAYLKFPARNILSSAPLNSTVSVGSWYRYRDALIFSFGLSTAKWNAAVSYDTNQSSLKRNLGNASSIELSLGYKIIKLNGYKRFSSPLI